MVHGRIIRIIAAAAAAAAALAVGMNLIYNKLTPAESIPSEDEISIHFRLDTKEDIGLLVYDYIIDGKEHSGGVSNADKSPIKHDSDDLIMTWNREELNSIAQSAEISMSFRIITDYLDPNYDNIYPDAITENAGSVSWTAYFGNSYYIVITGDRINGYKSELIK